VIVANGLAATNAGLGVRTRHQALVRFEAALKSLARELSDVRVLTWASDLNESFTRSQIEIRALLAALAYETGGMRETQAEAPALNAAANASGAASASVDSDWPYLAF